MNARKIEVFVISTVALHSLVLGVAMLVAPIWTLGLVGWQYDGPAFFPAQSGVFLVLLGGAYWAGIRFRPFAWFLVVSKGAAVLFLVAEVLLSQDRPILLLAALLDALMGTAVAIAVTASVRAARPID